MARHRAPKDLFGNPVRRPRPRYEAALERADKRTLVERAARVRWLAKVIPERAYFGMPLETFYILENAKSSFVYGNYVAVIVLATSFVDHWFAAQIGSRGFRKEASRGLAQSIKAARENGLVEPIILEKVERLRLVRNPFVHLKPIEHEHNLGRRSFSLGTHPDGVLEHDAKEAVVAMYAVATYAFGRS